MNVSMVYPNIERWVVPNGILESTLDGVKFAGRHRRESGAVWLGKRARISVVTAVALLHGDGVLEDPNYWQASPEVLATVARWSTPRSVCLLAMVHTHMSGVPPTLSWTDRHCGVRIPGVLAIVIGEAGKECDYRKWGWHVFETGKYHRLPQSELTQRLRVENYAFEAWTADSNGIAPLVTHD